MHARLRIVLLVLAATLPGLAAWAVAGPPRGGAAPVALASGADRAEGARAVGFKTILEKDLERHLVQLASGSLEGRDSPSLGLERAAEYIEARFEEIGLTPARGDDYRMAFDYGSSLPLPVEKDCSLTLTDDGGEPQAFEYGQDFVPVAYADGEGQGSLVFLGFGIEERKERYHEISKRHVKGRVALIVEGEPNHYKKFDGQEVTRAASLWRKLGDLADAGAAAVLVARRERGPSSSSGGEEDAGPRIGFRHTWAHWKGEQMTRVPRELPSKLPPTLEVTMDCASALLGEDVGELARRMDRTAKTQHREEDDRIVRVSAKSVEGPVMVDNVVGLLRGSDPELAEEYVVIGAHYDHVGVDERGRIGFGADDNASGTAALIELAEALAESPPRRSVLFCAFGAEEDGLVGSRAFCDDPPVPASAMVAMLNMDMIGRGKDSEVVVLGVAANPSFEDLLERARKLGGTGVKDVVVARKRVELGNQERLWERSDHYPFHQEGVPAMFFMEGLPIGANADYHTWRDTIDLLDLDKMLRTTRLVFNTVWLLATDAERPPAPRG